MWNVEDENEIVGPDSDSGEEDSASSDDEIEENIRNQITWKRESGANKFTPPASEFDDSEPRFNDYEHRYDCESPLAILKTFVDSRIVRDILFQTNLHARAIKRSNPRALRTWTQLKDEEFWTFLGLQLLTGIVKKPRLRDYWSSDELIETPAFAKHMSRNRFEEILRCLHFSDNEDPPANRSKDRLWKLGTFLPNLLENFNSRINPGEFLCLDESLMGFQGRLSFLQYNPLKRSRFGIKYFALVDSETQYLITLMVYLGKATEVDSKLKEYCGCGGATVIKLLENYMQRNHKVVVDNYFNSPRLQEYLALRKTYCLGTVRVNRKEMPKSTSKLSKGAVESYYSDHMLYERWNDRRQVNMLNSFIPHDMELVPTNNPNNSRDKPHSVVLYNKFMGGVDHVDQILAPYESQRKSIRWYKKFSFHLFDLAVYNAFVLKNHLSGTRKVVYREFLLELIKEMLNQNKTPRKKIGRPLRKLNDNGVNIVTLEGHLPVKVLKSTGKANRSDCFVCKKSGKRKSTSFKCEPCNKRLCIGGTDSCYTKYHQTSITENAESPFQTSQNNSYSSPENQDSESMNFDPPPPALPFSQTQSQSLFSEYDNNRY